LTNTLQKKLNKVLREKRELERKIAHEEAGLSSVADDPNLVAEALAEEEEDDDDEEEEEEEEEEEKG
jgi:hypothetical protein